MGEGPIGRAAAPAMRYAIDLCRLYAQVDRPVVFVGPVGSGKTTLARELAHRAAPGAPCVVVGSGELVEGLHKDTLFGHVVGAFTDAKANRPGALKEAGRGILLLDDLALMPLRAQAAILRVMETRHYRPVGSSQDETARCRILFATTAPPDELVAQGRMLRDLKSRLGEFVVPVPSLRACREDIPRLAERFARDFCTEQGRDVRVSFDDDAMALLTVYAWPENVRELRGVVERSVVHAGWHAAATARVRPGHLPERIRTHEPEDYAVPLSADLVAYVLRETGGNKSEAARRLRRHRNTIGRYAPPSK